MPVIHRNFEKQQFFIQLERTMVLLRTDPDASWSMAHQQTMSSGCSLQNTLAKELFEKFPADIWVATVLWSVDPTNLAADPSRKVPRPARARMQM